MDNTEVLLDDMVSNRLQNEFYNATEICNKALEKNPQIPVTYTLHYSYSENGREIPQALLENLYVFRNKLWSIKPLPPE